MAIFDSWVTTGTTEKSYWIGNISADIYNKPQKRFSSWLVQIYSYAICIFVMKNWEVCYSKIDINCSLLIFNHFAPVKFLYEISTVAERHFFFENVINIYSPVLWSVIQINYFESITQLLMYIFELENINTQNQSLIDMPRTKDFLSSKINIQWSSLSFSHFCFLDFWLEFCLKHERLALVHIKPLSALKYCTVSLQINEVVWHK